MTIRIQNNLNLGGLLPAHVTREALEAGAEHVREVAQSRAPLLTGAALHKANREERPGTLRESAYSRVISDVTAEIGFTDFAAAWQEENLDYEHEDGQAKFLASSLVSEKDETLRIIAARMREGLGG